MEGRWVSPGELRVSCPGLSSLADAELAISDACIRLAYAGALLSIEGILWRLRGYL